MSVMLMRYANYKGYDISQTVGLSNYADSNMVSACAVLNMQLGYDRR